MEKELTEILEQLRSLTAKVEALLAVSEPAELSEPAGLSEPEELSVPAEPVAPAEFVAPAEPVDSSDNSDFSEPYEIAPRPEIQMPAAIKFSLNDRFRFQRVIFGNSPERMANAMTAISAMTTADEVYAYLTNVLNRNVDDPDVEDFFREVTLRFSDHKPLII